jgi:hypothetical protein
MTGSELLQNIIANYQRHGWQLRRVLLRPETRAAMTERAEMLQDANIQEADFDALWFSRPSHANREAWELRLFAEQPYALFQAFDADEKEAAREAVRHEMETRMREYAARK